MRASSLCLACRFLSSLLMTTAAGVLVIAGGQSFAAAAGATEAQGLPPAVENPANLTPPSPAALAIKARLAERKDRSLLATAEEIKAVGAFFDARQGKPLFADANGLTPRAVALLAEFAQADEWGMPAGELVPQKVPVDAKALNEAEIADAEVRMSLAVLKYARYARGGRIAEPGKQLATYIDRVPQLIEPKVVLEAIAAAAKPEAVLAGMNPRHAAFEALRKAYNEARKAKAAGEEIAEFPSGPSLKPGGKHPQIAIVRQRLKVAVPTVDGVAGDPAVFDPVLTDAVIAFQQANGLEPADGIVGGKTRRALNSLIPPSARKLLANMEQWRWMPVEMGATHIAVNIPEFTLRMVKDNAVIHSERVVTGLVTNQTPVFSDQLATVVLQPDWVLPESIKIKEALPSLLDGGGMFYSNGLKIKKGETPVDPRSVDWSSANLKVYTFYQPPGEANVLGKVKFLFPNKHAVYLHDTPSKPLFEKSVRAFSHGCVRVRNPVRLAELVLMADKGWDAAKVKGLLEDGPEDNKVALDRKIPVHVTYFTAVPDETGKIRSYADIYGHEERIALALEGRWGDIEIPDDHLAPVEDREFEFRAAANERRQRDEYEVQPKYKGGGIDNVFKSIFGGF
ncbi:MAG: L,D-transpeptidase family protein [Hyphomicrobiaceae bacterium]